MLIKTEVEITPRRIADLMISAIEGGSNYWCESVKLLSAYDLFKVGEEYDTKDDKTVKLIGRENAGTTYETMFCADGIHRYVNRDFGRVTGTPFEKLDPRCLRMPIWYDIEEIYKERTFNSSGNFVPELRFEVREHEPSSDQNVEGSWIVNLSRMKRAFNLMNEYGKPKGFHFRNFMEENDDAETADVWFQLAVFGEVVYG